MLHGEGSYCAKGVIVRSLNILKANTPKANILKEIVLKEIVLKNTRNRA
ncbi:hypothetical protein [Mastigocoleus testarum]|nr:hypothetical protein [Mastigocoleus testarum]